MLRSSRFQTSLGLTEQPPSALRTAAVLLLASLTMVGCHSTRTAYVQPRVDAPEVYPHGVSRAATSLDRWWRHFADPRLDELVETALRRNADLLVAKLRVQAAQQQLHLAVVNPTSSAGYAYADSKFVNGGQPSIDSHSFSATVNYLVDLWGQLAAVQEVASWEAHATDQDREKVELSLISTTITLYYQLANLNQQIGLGEETIAYAERILALAEGQGAFGATSKLEILEAEENVDSQQFAQAGLLEQRIELRNALTVLLNGELPPENNELARISENPPPEVDAGLPALLLGRRPDLRAAEMRLREAVANTDATRLSFYPQMILTAGMGTASAELSQAIRNPVGTLMGALTAPIIQFEQAKYSNALARTQQEEAFAAFEKTLLQAMYDVDNALSARTKLTEEALQLERSFKAATEVERLSKALYSHGAVALKVWLDAQQTRRQAEISLGGNRLQRLENYVTLCEALGGDTRTPRAPSP
jgi:NodT family efflux transporter outer membrane factor (OMF) lipoprotein